jgi:hypothetical protein
LFVVQGGALVFGAGGLAARLSSNDVDNRCPSTRPSTSYSTPASRAERISCRSDGTRLLPVCGNRPRFDPPEPKIKLCASCRRSLGYQGMITPRTPSKPTPCDRPARLSRSRSSHRKTALLPAAADRGSVGETKPTRRAHEYFVVVGRVGWRQAWGLGEPSDEAECQQRTVPKL